MKRFLIQISLCLLACGGLFFLYYHVSDYILKRYNGPSTRDQIDSQFKNIYNQRDSINLVVFGNSRVYRGLNPLKFNQYAFNFAHDNDSYNQIYYKLKTVLEICPNLQTVIIGYDYFQFSFISDSRNYVYKNYLDAAYLDDYEDRFFNENIQPLLTSRIRLRPVIRAMMHRTLRSSISERGQYTFDSKSRPDDQVKRESTILPIQDGYFHKILALIGNTDIKVYFITMPIRDGEYDSYTENDIKIYQTKMDSVCRNFKNVEYFDLSREADFLDYRLYTDITHFNAVTADCFSGLVNRLITIEDNDAFKNH